MKRQAKVWLESARDDLDEVADVPSGPTRA